MIPNKERWHYLAVKKLSVFLRGITSKHHEDLYCLNCLCSFVTKKKMNCIKKYLIKTQFIIYGDLECIIEKIDTA